jgi:hypothetical protein
LYASHLSSARFSSGKSVYAVRRSAAATWPSHQEIPVGGVVKELAILELVHAHAASNGMSCLLTSSFFIVDVAFQNRVPA